MSLETLQPPAEALPELPPPVGDQPPSPVEPAAEQPFYTLDEAEIRARISAALSEKPVEAPIIHVSYAEWNNDRVEDVERARAQAHAENPYRTAIKAKWDEARAIVEPVYSVEGGRWLDLVRHPIKTFRGTKGFASIALLEIRANNAAQIVGEQYDKMVTATRPFIPKLEIPDLFQTVKANENQPAEPGAVAEKSSQRHTLATEQIIQQLNLDAQLGEQVTALTDAKIITSLSNGEQGIVGPDGQEYPSPTPDQLRDIVERNLDLIKYKAGQGFTRLIAVPAVTSHAQLEASMKTEVLEQFRADNLHDAEGKPVLLPNAYRTQDTGEQPIIVGNDCESIHDLDGETHSTRGHAYKGKHREDKDSIPGWEIMMVRNMSRTPTRRSELVFMGGRPEFLAGAAPEQYDKFLRSHPALRGESGFTLSTWYVYALTELERDGTLIDAHGGTLLLGSYAPGMALTSRRAVPWIGWGREYPNAPASNQLAIGAIPKKVPDLGETLSVRTVVKLS
jgi:hypothetical protein